MQGFIRRESRDIVIVKQDPAELLHALSAYEAPPSILERLREEYTDDGLQRDR